MTEPSGINRVGILADIVDAADPAIGDERRQDLERAFNADPTFAGATMIGMAAQQLPQAVRG